MGKDFLVLHWSILGRRLGVVLGPSWGGLRVLGVVLVVLGRFGAVLVRLGAVLGRLGAVLGRSRA